MAMKRWFRQLQPVQLYLMLGLTLLFFIVELVMSHMTHALTLLVDSYHMLCNLLALVGCIITIKYGSANVERDEDLSSKESLSGDVISTCSKVPPASPCQVHNATAGCTEHDHEHHHHVNSSEEKKLKNTFGWARIDVLVMLIGCVFLASLCFSLIVEALQTLIHIEHHDEMHHAIPVMCVGASGLLLNGLCYLLIGGYTFHQGSFLHVTPSGGIVLDGTVNKECMQNGENDTSTEAHPTPRPQVPQRQGFREMCRDVVGCVLVIMCSVIVYFTDQQVAKYVDPALSILSAVLLFTLSYPYMKESGSILLQTIPGTINIESLRSELLKAFPDIINVHDLHIWRLTATKVFSTAHIIFLNSKDYVRITKDVTEFFHDQGITQVTIQPEFFKMDNRSNLTELPNIHENRCLVQCRELGCHSRHCCMHNDLELEKVTVDKNNHQHSHTHSHNHKNNKKHTTTRMKALTSPKKISPNQDVSSCDKDTNFETTSNEEDNRTGGSMDDSSLEEALVVSNKDEKIATTNLAFSNTEKDVDDSRQTEVPNECKNCCAQDTSELHKDSGDETTSCNNSKMGVNKYPCSSCDSSSVSQDCTSCSSSPRSSNCEEKELPTYVAQSKLNVPCIMVTQVVEKSEIDKLRSKSEVGKEAL